MRSRRPWWLIAGVIVVLAGAAIAVRFVWLPHYRPALHGSEGYGIDVSHHQGAIDWSRVAADDIDFAYIKAMEGGDVTDSRFHQNWVGAARAGLARGAYHFFTLCTPGRVQAEHFLRTVPQDPGMLPPAIDLELAGNCAARPGDTAVLTELRRFVRAVEAGTGKRVIVYVGGDFLDRYPGVERLGLPLWSPRFLRRPGDDGWVIWQVMGWVHVDGIDGDVDLDVMRDLAPTP